MHNESIDFKNIKGTDNYFYPISHLNFSPIISGGLVLPASYVRSRTEKDIQDEYPDYLALFKEIPEFEIQHGEKIVLELALTEEERKSMQDMESFKLFDKPLPVTRVNKVIVPTKKIKSNILSTLKDGDVGDFPEDKIKVEKISFIPKEKNKRPKAEIKSDDYAKKILRFDKILGLMSNLKIFNYFYVDKTNIYSNISDQFVSALSIFNKKFPGQKKDISSFEKLIKNEPDKEKKIEFLLFELLHSEEQITKDFIESLGKEKIINKEEQQFFKLLDNTLERPEAVKQLSQNENKLLPIIAFIYNFRNKSTNDKDNFRFALSESVNHKIAAHAMAIMGMYFGYSAIRPRNKVEIQNKNFANLPKEFEQKFSLKSQFEYVLIESVYQYVFNDIVSDSKFETYLTMPNDYKTTIPSVKLSKHKYELSKFDILDEKQYKIKVNTDQEIAQSIIKQYPEKINNRFYLYIYVLNNHKTILEVEAGNTPYFSKNKFIKLLKDMTISEQLSAAINLDKTYILEK